MPRHGISSLELHVCSGELIKRLTLVYMQKRTHTSMFYLIGSCSLSDLYEVHITPEFESWRDHF